MAVQPGCRALGQTASRDTKSLLTGPSVTQAWPVGGSHQARCGDGHRILRPCSSHTAESGAAARQLDGRAVGTTATTTTPPKAVLIHGCRRRESKEPAQGLKEATPIPLGPAATPGWIIGRAFLPIPSISTQMLNEETAFLGLPSRHTQPGQAPQGREGPAVCLSQAPPTQSRAQEAVSQSRISLCGQL